MLWQYFLTLRAKIVYNYLLGKEKLRKGFSRDINMLENIVVFSK